MPELTINADEIAAALRKHVSTFSPTLEQARVGRVLEVGCGTGISTRALAKCGARVIGIDPGGECAGQSRKAIMAPAFFRECGKNIWRPARQALSHLYNTNHEPDLSHWQLCFDEYYRGCIQSLSLYFLVLDRVITRLWRTARIWRTQDTHAKRQP